MKKFDAVHNARTPGASSFGRGCSDATMPHRRAHMGRPVTSHQKVSQSAGKPAESSLRKSNTMKEQQATSTPSRALSLARAAAKRGHSLGCAVGSIDRRGIEHLPAAQAASGLGSLARLSAAMLSANCAPTLAAPLSMVLAIRSTELASANFERFGATAPI